MLVDLIHVEHFEFSIKAPPQFRHDSSGNFIQIKLMKNEYKQRVEIIRIKD